MIYLKLDKYKARVLNKILFERYLTLNNELKNNKKLKYKRSILKEIKTLLLINEVIGDAE